MQPILESIVMTPDPTLIEQVARALCKVTRADPDALGVDGNPRWKGWAQFAEAAIATLLGSAALPSEAMIEAGTGVLFAWGHLTREELMEILAAMRAATPTAPPENLGASSGSHASTEPCGLGPSGFDPARVRQLLDAVAPICVVVADYATHPGPVYEACNRMLGRIGRNGESPPYVTWGQLCAIEEAAYSLASQTDAAEFALDAIATEARRAATTKIDAVHEGAGPEDIAHD